jgi:hypothetical protein
MGPTQTPKGIHPFGREVDSTFWGGAGRKKDLLLFDEFN